MPLNAARRFDLHMHSDRSDGRYAPEDVLERAGAGGLEVIALTDHDLASPLDPGPHRVGTRTVTVIAGAEVSGVHDGTELHLLVYFPGKVPIAFRDFCEGQARVRAARYEQAVQNLALSDLPPVDASARAGQRSVTRLHLAHALVKAGHAQSTGDAFSRFLGERHGKVPPFEITFSEAIRLARSCGGVCSWAHPPIGRMRHLDVFAAAGLQGIEALRPMVSSSDRKVYRKAARRHGLFLTGGSDWHGWSATKQLGLFSVDRPDLAGFVDALSQAA